jgi:adenosylmethionine-8-amino-7-oxononanoate aminotransferase
MLWLPTFDSPQLPMPLSKLVRGVKTALPVIKRGEGVMVYCRQGRHRSVAMACCILIGMGYSSEDAVALVKNNRAIADPDAEHINDRIVKFAGIWRAGEIV